MNPSPRNRTSWFVWLGAVVLAVSVLGASKSLQSPGENTSSSSNPNEIRAGGFGHVDVEGGVAHMYPVVSGEVVEVIAKDGQDVKKNDPLFRLDDTLAKIELNRAENAVQVAEVDLERAKAGIEQHKEALAAQRSIIEAKQYKIKAAEEEFAYAKRLNDAGQGPKEKKLQAENAVAGFKKEVEGEEQKERMMKLEDPKRAVRLAEINLEDKKEQVKKARLGVDKCTLKAPADGKVLRMLVTVGETLGPTPRQPAVQFAAAGKLVIRAEIDQEFAKRVFKGQTADIHDDVRTGDPWSGTVRHVSDWYTHRRSIMQEPLQFNDVRTLEVMIDLDNPSADLKIGQRVRVTMK